MLLLVTNLSCFNFAVEYEDGNVVLILSSLLFRTEVFTKDRLPLR
jgi:hypothetical protein